MPANLNAMIAVQTRDGLTFGYARSVDLTSMVLEVQGDIQVGEEVEWRMELKGYKETAMGALVVERVRKPTEAGSWPIFHARISDLPDEDRKVLEGWMEDYQAGGTSKRVEREIEEALLRSWESRPEFRKDEAARKFILERMAERKAKRKKLFKKKISLDDEGEGDPYGIAAEASRTTTRPADAIRAALKRAPGAPPQRNLEDAIQQVVSRAAADRAEEEAKNPQPKPKEANRPAREGDPGFRPLKEGAPGGGGAGDAFRRALGGARPGTGGTAQEQDPSMTVVPGNPRFRVDVRFRSREALVRSLDGGLRNNQIAVRPPTPLTGGQVVNVVLVLPSGREIQSRGGVTSAPGAGMSIVISLTLDDRKLIAQEAGRPL